MYVKGWTAKEEVALYRRVKNELSGDKKISLKQAVRNIHWWYADRSIDSLYDKARKLITEREKQDANRTKPWDEIEEQLFKDMVTHINRGCGGIREAAKAISHKYPGRTYNQLENRFKEILYSTIEDTSKKKLERYTIYKYLYPIRAEI